MIDRRRFLAGALALGVLPSRAFADVPAPQPIPFNSDAAPGTVIVSTGERRLYLVLGRGTARAYPIGVGKQGLAFEGTAEIGRKAEWPRWQPTENMIRREPQKYARYARGVPGGPGNPLGARALYLHRAGRDTMYRIHGTNDPASVGRAASNGCIRLLNDHVIDLYNRVGLGATVIVR